MCVLQKEEAEKAAQEEAERKEAERVVRMKREEEERIARKKVGYSTLSYLCAMFRKIMLTFLCYLLQYWLFMVIQPGKWRWMFVWNGLFLHGTRKLWLTDLVPGDLVPGELMPGDWWCIGLSAVVMLCSSVSDSDLNGFVSLIYKVF